MEDVQILRKRLLYQSQHRGMGEMDKVLGHFAEIHISSMDYGELKEFEFLLNFSDDQLYGWFFEKKEVPKSVSLSLIQNMLHFFTPS